MVSKIVLALVIIYAANSSALPRLTDCKCSLILQPLCASDGNTYGSECYLQCEKTNGRNIYKLSDGHCREEDCDCPLTYAPVCGSNNHDFINECMFKCEQKRIPELKLKRDGRCDGVDIFAED